MKKQKTKFKQTEIGMIPEDWDVKELREVLQEKGYIRGPFGSALKRPELKRKGIPVYEQANAIYDHKEFRYFIDKENYKKLKRFTVKENDLIISCSGTFGKVSIISKDDPKGIISQALLILRPETSKINPHFLKYFFISKEGCEPIASRSIGSVQVNIAKREIIEKIPLKTPKIKEQKAITKILSDLDSKIELLQNQNKTLESIGQAIFKQWFVDFEFPNEKEKPYKSSGGEMVGSELGEIPKGWVVDVALNLFKLEYGWHLPEWNRKEGHIPVFGSGGLSGLHNESFVEGPGVILGRAGKISPDSIYYSHIPFCPLETTFYVSTENKKLIRFLFYFLKTMPMVNTGSSIPNLSRNSIHNARIIIPLIEVIEYFDALIEKLFDKINEDELQIKALIQIRDSLLPKLMSGKIRVPVEARA